MHNLWTRRLLLVTLLLALPIAGWAAPKSQVIAQATGSWFDTARIEYETALSNTTAIAVRADFLGKRVDDLYVQGLGGGASYRFYPLEGAQAPAGMFVGPAVDVLSVSASNAGETGSSVFYDVLLDFGYHFFFGEGLSFSLVPQVFIGYTFGSLTVGGKTADYTGFGYGAGLGLGLAW